MAQSIVCGGCGGVVPYGRLSCPECGEMLASVAGVGRRSSAGAYGPGTVAAGAGTLTDWPDAADRAAPSVLGDPAADGMDAVAGQMTTWPESGRSLAFDDDDDLDFDTASSRVADPIPARSTQPAPSVAESLPAPSAHPALETIASSPATAASPPAFVPPAASPMAAPTPGAYVPPILQPAGPAAPARAWAGHNGDPAAGGLAAAGVATVGAATAGAAAAPETGVDRAPLVAAERAVEFVGWLAIAGSALAMVGFLLPWSVSVIGAEGVGYFDRWGFAGSGHVLLVVGLVTVLGAAVMRERVPLWLGIGLPGLGLGALLVGLVWPYLVGPLGAQLGVLAVTLGALMLVAAGISAVVVDRHARDAGVV